MGRQKCTIKWQGQMSTFKLQDKSLRLNGKAKNVRLDDKTKVYI